MANEKLQINIPLGSVKNATQQRTRKFLCCSCLGPKESLSDSAITVTLGKYDECDYVVEKLAIKRIPTSLITPEQLNSDKVEKHTSDTTTGRSTQLDDCGDAYKNRPTGITFSSYYKMVPNKPSPDKIPEMREKTESSIITLSDSKNQPKLSCTVNAECEASAMNKHKILERNYEHEWEYSSYNNNNNNNFHTNMGDKANETERHMLHDHDRNTKYLEQIDEGLALNIDPETKKTLQILGGAPAGENIHRYYHHFARGPIRCIEHPGIANKYLDIQECHQEPVQVNIRNKYNIDTDEISTTSTSQSRQGLKWKILVKHHEKSKRNNYLPSVESTTEACSDSEF